mgnify:FL=1
MKAMTGGMGTTGWSGPAPDDVETQDAKQPVEDLEDIRAQLAAMQEQLAKMGKKKS